MRIPKYRDDIKGNVRAILADCTQLMKGEINHADFFMVQAEDCTLAMQEYRDLLTDAELARCFKAALR